jgi:DNA helicase-2/ATP-dependent DNA helicase PcrA
VNKPNTSVSVDDEIYSCLNLDVPKSYFLFAGAGSGKTRSLVNVMKRFRDENGQRLRLNGQKVAIITYTNAACDEIKRRLEFDSSFIVSTIHSFAWELIKSFQIDIKEWVRANLISEIGDLEEKNRTGRAGTKTAIDREKQIISKKQRLEHLDKIKSFSYNPNGINSGRDSLNHAEVISIAANFLYNRPLMQKILVRQYPILLIDESQDTKKELIDAFFAIQGTHGNQFSLGLFGDTMQRIYTDGKIDLGNNLPADWAKPEKLTNHRCPNRIITLINKIRSDVDTHIQQPSGSSEKGAVCLFIVNTNNNISKTDIEINVMRRMSEISGDSNWLEENQEVKVLTLEHHMAAKRGGFLDFFEPLYRIDKLKTGLIDGTLSGISFLTQQLLPMIKAKQAGDEFKVAQIVREYSPILDRNALKESKDPLCEIRNANFAVESLIGLWSENRAPVLAELLRKVAELKLLPIPEILAPIVYRSTKEQEAIEADESDRDEIIDAWDAALKSPFSQLVAYADYISDKSRFGTNQGVKGLEFSCVMVILDDEEARGFLFSYEKLFGAKELSDTDNRNIQEGRETSLDRTRRLFYVTCSRAKKSLAIVAYTKEPAKVKNYAISQGWFNEDEVIVL